METPRKRLSKYWCSVPHCLSDNRNLVHSIRKCCIWLDNQCVLFLNSTLDNGWLYLATGTMPVSNEFPLALCPWHIFSRVIFIYFCQDLSPLMNKLQVMQTENRSKNTFSYPAFNSSNCNVTINYQLIISYGNVPFEHIEQKPVTCTFLLNN
jgi:hypothetical protein